MIENEQATLEEDGVAEALSPEFYANSDGVEKPEEKDSKEELVDFDELSTKVNIELAELDMTEDSAEMVGALTKIANAGNPEWRVWAGKMMVWHGEMAKIIKAMG